MGWLHTLAASTVLALAGGGVLHVGTDGFRAFTTESARRIAVHERPITLPSFVVETDSGTRLDLVALRGRWLLIDFIYTRCPSYCSALGAEFAQLEELLAAPIARGEAALLSISFDPAHDTPEELAAYLHRSRARDGGWIAARPLDADTLEQLMRSFGITVVPDGVGGFVHNSSIHLVDPQGRLVAIANAGEGARLAQQIAVPRQR